MDTTDHNWAELEKGTYLTQGDVENIIGVKMEDDYKKYSFLLLGLKGEIERELSNAGKNFTVKTKDYGIEILSDPKALQANAKDFRAGLRKTYKAHKRLGGVDMSKLDEDERRCLESERYLQSRVIVAIEKEAATIKIEFDTPDRPSLSMQGDTIRIGTEEND